MYHLQPQSSCETYSYGLPQIQRRAAALGDNLKGVLEVDPTNTRRLLYYLNAINNIDNIWDQIKILLVMVA